MIVWGEEKSVATSRLRKHGVGEWLTTTCIDAC
jgi:hypothetical protein